MGVGEYGELYPWLAVDSTNPDHVIVGVRLHYGEIGPVSLLQHSFDAGRSWSNTIESLFKVLQGTGLEGLFSVTVPGELRNLTIDPEDPQVLYAAGEKGARISADGGATWRESSEGMQIPLVRSLVRPSHGDLLFAGTPGGLYLSRDNGVSWTDANLWLQFAKNTRRELGGASFIDAYWRARYFHFIDDETAWAPIDDS
jgi:photosystem II stability/assembly factor-like uncharacterized protein